MKYDLIIIGSGVAGLAAAVYGRRYKLETLVIEGKFGGETATAGTIENYPGIKSIDGYELMKAMREQARDLGTVFQKGKADRIQPPAKEGEPFLVSAGQEQFQGATVILAIGAERRHLGLPREEELTNKGVHYCWTCDGPLYGGKRVAMVGGGDSSVKGVNFLAEYAEKIYLIVRGKEIHAEPINLERMKKLRDKVEVLLEHEVKELVGAKKLEKLILSSPGHKEGEELDDLVVDGLFVEIGFDPDRTFAEQLGLQVNEKGYTKVDNMMKTNVPGVFAAGDATDHFGSFKQDITASAMGAVAATSAYEYHQTINNNN